jgi:hypothetical protein
MRLKVGDVGAMLETRSRVRLQPLLLSYERLVLGAQRRVFGFKRSWHRSKH